jgi:hypothetical protein
VRGETAGEHELGALVELYISKRHAAGFALTTRSPILIRATRQQIEIIGAVVHYSRGVQSRLQLYNSNIVREYSKSTHTLQCHSLSGELLREVY